MMPLVHSFRGPRKSNLNSFKTLVASVLKFSPTKHQDRLNDFEDVLNSPCTFILLPCTYWYYPIIPSQTKYGKSWSCQKNFPRLLNVIFFCWGMAQQFFWRHVIVSFEWYAGIEGIGQLRDYLRWSQVELILSVSFMVSLTYLRELNTEPHNVKERWMKMIKLMMILL